MTVLPDHFACLGLERRFDLDPKVLERAYFEAQRRHHPDRFVGRPAPERARALVEAASVNEAYEVLREPLSRACHLLALKDRPLPGGDGRSVGDPALLMEAMEWREQLEEADGAPALAALQSRLKAELGETQGRLAAAFGRGDDDAATREALRLTYLRRIEPDLRRRMMKAAG